MLCAVDPASLRTERLLLRPWRPAEDLEAFAALNADPAVMRWVVPNRPLSRSESAELLDRIVSHWETHGFGLWAVEPHAGSVPLIGFAGLAVPSFLPAVLPTVEVGWRLSPAWWGRGLATEAARACIDHAADVLGLRAVVSIIDPENAASLRVATKLGMRPGRERAHPLTRRVLQVMELELDGRNSRSRSIQ
jgi:RimJ/RimL family protein N-acetyltransferase